MDPYRHEPDAGYVAPPLPPAQIVPIPGRGEMFVRRGGRPDGTPVLLLHGWMATADLNWFPLFAALGERHPIVALDLRGHGRAPRSPGMFTLEECADDAAAVLRALGIARAVVVGYSMGGPVALLLWHRHPNLVNGLVLEATALEWSTSRAERLQWRAIGMVGLLLRWPTGRIALLRAMGGVESLPRSLLTYRSWAEGEFRRNDPMEMAEAGRALAAFDARPFAASVDVPSAVVVTTRDRLVPPARQLALAEAIGATVFRIDEDHSAVALRPDEVAEITLLAIAAVDVDLGTERRDEGPAPLSGDPAAAPGS
jgi:3-oxoadipate enol-lactonase